MVDSPKLPSRRIVLSEAYSHLLEPNNTWIVVAAAGGVLLLYAISRIVSMQRRIKDLESRPPVDDIILRGMIRHQLGEVLEQKKQALAKLPPVAPPVAPWVAPAKVAEPEAVVPPAPVVVDDDSVEGESVPPTPVKKIGRKKKQAVEL